jgi:hypothetical protein
MNEELNSWKNAANLWRASAERSYRKAKFLAVAFVIVSASAVAMTSGYLNKRAQFISMQETFCQYDVGVNSNIEPLCLAGRNFTKQGYLAADSKTFAKAYPEGCDTDTDCQDKCLALYEQGKVTVDFCD